MASDISPQVQQQPPLRAAAVRHRGPYPLIGQAFARLEPLADAAQLLTPQSHLIAIYYDNPTTTPAEALRSDAGVLLADGAAVPAGLTEVELATGRYITLRHTGGYDGLPASWAHLRESMGTQRLQRRNAPSYEIYLNTPANAAPADLVTDIYIPVEQ